MRGVEVDFGPTQGVGKHVVLDRQVFFDLVFINTVADIVLRCWLIASLIGVTVGIYRSDGLAPYPADVFQYCNLHGADAIIILAFGDKHRRVAFDISDHSIVFLLNSLCPFDNFVLGEFPGF